MMLVRDPKKRASASELLKHEWILKNKEKKDVDEGDLLDISENLRFFV